MKKLVIVLFIFCSVLFVSNSIFKCSFANNNCKPIKQIAKSQNTIIEENKTLETNNVSYIDNSDSNNQNSNLESKEYILKSNNINSKHNVVKNNDSKVIELNKNQYIIKSDNSNKTIENLNLPESLTKDDALNLLLDMNPNLVYSYQGDENTFPIIKNKGFCGYVFLPNADTDLGYFVDKNTSNIYYFHPSGYLEKIK